MGRLYNMGLENSERHLEKLNYQTGPDILIHFKQRKHMRLLLEQNYGFMFDRLSFHDFIMISVLDISKRSINKIHNMQKRPFRIVVRIAIGSCVR